MTSEEIILLGLPTMTKVNDFGSSHFLATLFISLIVIGSIISFIVMIIHYIMNILQEVKHIWEHII